MTFIGRDDRRFVDRIATRISGCAGDRKATFFDGEFSDHEPCRKGRFGDAATRSD